MRPMCLQQFGQNSNILSLIIVKNAFNSCCPYPHPYYWFCSMWNKKRPVKSYDSSGLTLLLFSQMVNARLKYMLIGNWTHFSTENSPPSGFSPASPAGLSKRRGGRLSTGRLSVGGRPSPCPPWGLEPSPSGLRPILLMPAPRIDHNRRIRGPIELIDQEPLLSTRHKKEKGVIVLFNWSKWFQLMCRILKKKNFNW